MTVQPTISFTTFGVWRIGAAKNQEIMELLFPVQADFSCTGLKRNSAHNGGPNRRRSKSWIVKLLRLSNRDQTGQPLRFVSVINSFGTTMRRIGQNPELKGIHMSGGLTNLAAKHAYSRNFPVIPC